MTTPLPQAVVFDFDGLMLDTETPIFQASAAALEALGHRLTVRAWASVVGHGEDDSFRALERAIGAPIDKDAYEEVYARQDRSWRESLPALDGVVGLLEALRADGVPCGIASSSSVGWVTGHLDRLGLRHHFTSVAARDRVGGRAKPAPDTYLLACRELGADPAGSVALEDSSPGIAAAVAAGMNVVVVPNAITVHTDLSAAHLSVRSLAELSPAVLAELVAVSPLRTGDPAP